MVGKTIKSIFKRKVKNMTTKKDLTNKINILEDRIINIELFIFIMLYKNKPIMVNGININRNSYFNSLIKSIVGKTIKPPPKQLELFRGTNATI